MTLGMFLLAFVNKEFIKALSILFRGSRLNYLPLLKKSVEFHGKFNAFRCAKKHEKYGMSIAFPGSLGFCGFLESVEFCTIKALKKCGKSYKHIPHWLFPIHAHKSMENSAEC